MGLVGEPGEERIVAVGRYFLDEQTQFAEVAFVVHEEFRGLGIASHLLRRLAQIAREKGFAGVTAQVLGQNTQMLRVFEGVLGRADEVNSENSETTLCYRFAEAS